MSDAPDNRDDEPSDRRSEAGDGGDDGSADGTAVDEQGVDVEIPRPPIEPESVDPEHAAFVVLGVVLTVAILVGAV